MGNCVFRGSGGVEDMIKVVTSNGGMMELCAPITAECITNEFPGHGLFRSREVFSQPLLHNEELQVGEVYYLLPLMINNKKITGDVTPYRMSLDNQSILKRSDAEVFPRYNSTGVWKVKLVISPEQLSEILSQDARTEALIESVRTVAKCGNGVSSSLASSDQWSLSSSWKASFDSH
ncbi:hypothetical protein F0562_014932 [Nyssa sinensis]|uniref:Uncharacterized protein n=1 Tax=Nyssa sinensis TaxID=561372 RepID=A0A5J4ZSN1_9ASTE|nr:hypothetical protein F0562_014932 [Nyssa sinensis]